MYQRVSSPTLPVTAFRYFGQCFSHTWRNQQVVGGVLAISYPSRITHAKRSEAKLLPQSDWDSFLSVHMQNDAVSPLKGHTDCCVTEDTLCMLWPSTMYDHSLVKRANADIKVVTKER